jgi:PhnB protein
VASWNPRGSLSNPSRPRRHREESARIGPEEDPVTHSSPTPQEDARIRAAIESWAAALRAKDVGRILSHYAPDVVTADLAPPLWNTGVGTLRKNFEQWFSTWAGPIGFEVRALHVTAGGDLAFARSLNRIHGARTDGSQNDVWVRATVCFRKGGDEWTVIHEHVSVPFYMDGSYRAAVDLKP